MERLPYIYALVLLVEAGALFFVYLTDPPLPSDALSIGLGWVGLASMVGLLVYSIARRSRALRRWAKLSYWLHFHIFLAVQGGLGVLFHCWHLFGREAPVNPLNPAVLSGIGTVVVLCSGVFGRYLYSRLPRTQDGTSAAERVFRRWIVAHRPMAAILYVVALVHVAFSYMFSAALAG